MGQKETRETWIKELHGAQLCAKKKGGEGVPGQSEGLEEQELLSSLSCPTLVHPAERLKMSLVSCSKGNLLLVVILLCKQDLGMVRSVWPCPGVQLVLGTAATAGLVSSPPWYREEEQVQVWTESSKSVLVTLQCV